VPFGSGEGNEARQTFNHSKFKRNAPKCRFCNLLLRSVEIADECPEHVVPLYRWTVGQTLRLQQTGFDVKYEYGEHPGLELYTTTGEFSIELRLGRPEKNTSKQTRSSFDSTNSDWKGQSRAAILEPLVPRFPSSVAQLQREPASATKTRPGSRK
jgi:hypothetical protein